MITFDHHYQFIDWQHSAIPFPPDADEYDEPYEHLGLLKSNIFNVGLTIGLNDYWNITLSQAIGERCMEWGDPLNVSAHHRTECSSSDFDNAVGGYLGDTRINIKYILENQGKGTGDRIFFGGGLIIPSKNTLTRNPYDVEAGDDGHDHYVPHRHFYLSDGTYKLFFESQFFRKRENFPIFWGGSLNMEYPLGKNKYGFTGSSSYGVSLVALSGPLSKIPKKVKLASVGLSLSMQHYNEAKWDETVAPNSESTMITPGISFLVNSSLGSFGISFQMPYIDNLSVNDGGVEQSSSQWQISLSFRKTLDKRIEKLYWK